MQSHNYSFFITGKNPENGHPGEDTEFSKRYYANGNTEEEAKNEAIKQFKSQNPNAALIRIE